MEFKLLIWAKDTLLTLHEDDDKLDLIKLCLGVSSMDMEPNSFAILEIVFLNLSFWNIRARDRDIPWLIYTIQEMWNSFDNCQPVSSVRNAFFFF